MTLKEFFIKYPIVAIAFSGGVDSSYLIYAAQRYALKVQAYYVKTAFQPQFEQDDASRLAGLVGVPLKEIFLDILLDKKITSNPPDRCYYCKKRIFTKIRENAIKDGFSILLDGTNASDEVSDRPGMKALKELEILSPLRLCGLTKSEIRKLSKEAQLFTWDKPAYACLATRIRIGQKIDKNVLERTEKAEDYMSSLGFRDFRVRMVGDIAKIELRKEQFPLLMENREEILGFLKGSYQSVCLDLEPRGGG